MNQRERWVGVMHFQPVDHVTDREFGYWAETLQAWHTQGLPEYVNDDVRADAYFGLESELMPPVNVLTQPWFEHEVIEDHDDYQILMSWDGAQQMVKKDSVSIPKYIRYAIETREDWERIKAERLNPSTPERVPSADEWTRWKAMAEASGQIVGIDVGSLFGFTRNWLGFENVSYAIMDDPEWIEEITEHLTNLTLSVIGPLIKDFKFDFGKMWEDICFNHGPIIQPRHFEEWIVPRLKRITGLLAENGCDVVYVDCDGNINELVPLWLDAGVNCMFPLEARGGTNAVDLRQKYGRRILLMGGVDKTRLIAGKEEIRKEIARIKPLVEDGGYIPHVDHRCPPDVTLENYLYYLKLKRETFGIPEPEPWEDRRDEYEWARENTKTCCR